MPKDVLTQSQMQEDFTIMINAVKEVHGGLHRFTAKEKLEQNWTSYYNQIQGPASKLEFIALLSEALTEVRDGHMRLEYDEETDTKRANASRFPLDVTIENGEKLMVLYNETPGNTTIKPGMEILSINGHSASAVIHTVMKTLSGDGYIETGKLSRTGRGFDSYYWLFVDQAETFEITAKTQTGETVNATLEGVKGSDRSDNRNQNLVNREILKHSPLPGRQSDIVTLNFSHNNDIAHLQVRWFLGEDFISEIDFAMEEIRSKNTEMVILDLRGNGGGVEAYGAHLISCFTDKPFRYFDRIEVVSIDPSFTTWKPDTYEDLRNGTVPNSDGGYLVTNKLYDELSIQEPADQPFTGQLFVLIDGGTFSTAADVSAILHNMDRGTFIGEETSGAYSGNTSGLNAQVELPNSEVSLKVHMYGFWNAVEVPEKGRGTLPHYSVENKVIDLIKGSDAQKSKAIELYLAKD